MMDVKKIDIIGIGYCSLDYMGVVSHIPIDSKVEIKNLSHQGGGPAATAIVTAAKFGVSTGFIGKVGDDFVGKFILEDFKTRNVEASGMVIEKGTSSAISFIWIEEATGNRSIAWNKGTKSSLKVEEVSKPFIKSAKIIHLDGHESKAAMEMIRIAKEYGCKISLDGGTITPNIEKIMKFTDILIVSEEFAVRFTGFCETYKYIKILKEYNPEVLIVTKGKNGFCGYIDGKYIEREAFKIKTIDTSGAGDIFHGAFLFAYMKKMDLNRALTFASATAALKCTRRGIRAALPTFKEVIKFIEDMDDKTQIW